MGKKFLLSAVLAAMLIDNSFGFELPVNDVVQNIISKANPVENNATSSKIAAPSEVIVTFKDDSNMSNIASEIGSIFSNATTSEYNLIKAMHIKVPGVAFDVIKSMLENAPFKDSIKTIEPNYAHSYIDASNDTYYNQLWAVENTGQEVNGESGTNDADMDVKEAWGISKGDSNNVVAVLDTGVDYTHSDLEDNMWKGAVNHGYDFAGDDDGNNDNNPMPDSPYDENGHYHGTHVAGTIGAVGDNSNGVSGVVQNVQIMAIKVFRPNGYGYTSDILEGLDYVSEQIDNGVKVVAINASYGGGGGSTGDSMDQAIQKLGDKGVVFCAAAGNEGKDIDSDPIYPASYSATNIITVAASDQDDKLASFSNYGKDTVDVAAPGTNILSTYPDNQYAYLQGTSMATPNVTGTVALLASVNPSSSVSDIIDAIKSGVDSKSDLNNKVSTSGRVNAYNAAKLLDDGSNNAPTASDDSATTDYEQAVVIDVLDNDSDSDGDSLSIKSVSTPSNGSAVIKDGKIEYTPNSGFSGTDSFSYTISDSKGEEASATVTVTVKEKANSAPEASNDNASVDEDKSVNIDVLANDKDSDGDSLSIKSISKAPSHGKAEIKNGKIEYTPEKNYNGDDSFKYKVADSSGAEAEAEVSITVKAVNDAPEAKSDDATTKEDTKTSIDVLKNDSDVDGDSLSIKDVTTPQHGSAKIVNGKIEYTPNKDFNGNDSFEYVVADSKGAESKTTVTVKVEAVNDAPVAKDLNINTQEDSKVSIKLEASDIDSSSLTYTIKQEPQHGSLSTNDGVTFTYTPDKNYNGADSFSYVANDGELSSNEATVNINIEAVNDAPVAKDDSATTDYEKSVVIDVLNNDSDIDGDTLSIDSVNKPNNGSAVVENGKIKYTPNAGFSGDDSFAYVIVDSSGAKATATVNVHVNEQESRDTNTPPTAKDDSATTDYETKVLINVLSNDSDANGDALSIKSVNAPANGSAVVKNGQIEYTPNSGFSGEDSFSYIITDSKGAQASATVKVTVKEKKDDDGGFINYAPIAQNDGTFYLSQNETKTLDVLANDRDKDGDTLTIKSVSSPKNGTAVTDGKVIKYTPNKDYAGSDTFEYTISDSKGAQASATVTVMVTKNSDDSDDKNEHVFPIIGSDGIEIPTKIIGEFINEIKGNVAIFKLKDSSGEIDVNRKTGEVELKGINAPVPANKLPVGTTVKVEKSTLKATFTLTTNIKFK